MAPKRDQPLTAQPCPECGERVRANVLLVETAQSRARGEVIRKPQGFVCSSRACEWQTHDVAFFGKG